MSTFEELKRRAAKAAVPRSLSESAHCATVGAAPETHRGDIFVGACIDTWSSLGFCAEHAAAAAMLTAGQNEIKRTVAIHHSGQVLAPAGVPRVHHPTVPSNLDTQTLVNNTDTATLRELLPHRWHAD